MPHAAPKKIQMLIMLLGSPKPPAAAMEPVISAAARRPQSARSFGSCAATVYVPTIHARASDSGWYSGRKWLPTAGADISNTSEPSGAMRRKASGNTPTHPITVASA